MILFRPVGQAEYDLLVQSDFTYFPPRLPEQPIFYPVLNQQYAHEIAQKWNTRYADSGYKGYVTRFQIDDAFVSRYPVQTVGPVTIRSCGFRRRSWLNSTATSSVKSKSSKNCKNA